MKKLILFSSIGFLCLVGEVHAQLVKGTKYLGATVSFYGQNNNADYPQGDKFTYHNFAVNPSLRFGKFVKDNVMLGLDLSPGLALQRNKNRLFETEVKSGTNLMTLGLNPYIRNYKSLSSKWAIYLHSSLNLSYLRLKNFDGDQTDYENGYSVGFSVRPGVSYWFSPRFALEADVNVLSLGVNYTDFNGNNTFGVSTGINTSLQQYFGIRASWYFQKAN